MKKFMFAVTVLFAVLAIGAVIAGVIALLMGQIGGLIIGLIAAGVFTIMSNSVAKSLREV